MMTKNSLSHSRAAKTLTPLLAALVFSCPADAAKRFGTITESDKLTLPPVCKLILIENTSAHQPVGQVQNAALLDRPEYRMAKGNIHLHHYCYGLINKNRYFNGRTPQERRDFLNETIGEIDYVLVNSPKEWPYFHQLFFEQAEMFFLAGDLQKALLKANNSLNHRPTFDKAHALISDIYVKQGKKEQAIQQLHRGLEADPSSKRLLRSLRDLNPKDPLLAKNASRPVSSGDDRPTNPNAASTRQTPEAQTNVTASEPMPVESRNNAVPNRPGAGQSEAMPASPPESPPATANPYCRFCP
jgi:hypothetical protein